MFSPMSGTESISAKNEENFVFLISVLQSDDALADDWYVGAIVGGELHFCWM